MFVENVSGLNLFLKFYFYLILIYLNKNLCDEWKLYN